MLTGPADFKCRVLEPGLLKCPDNGSKHTSEQFTHQFSAGLVHYKYLHSFYIWTQSVPASQVPTKSNIILLISKQFRGSIILDLLQFLSLHSNLLISWTHRLSERASLIDHAMDFEYAFPNLSELRDLCKPSCHQ